MEKDHVLEKSGLTEKQARVYSALLELGQASVQSIAEKSNLKRPTCYVILDELKTLGFVSVVPQAGKSLFVAESPDLLLSGLTKKTELLKRYLPELLAVHNAKVTKPKVRLYQGVSGLRQVYDSILIKSEVRFFGTVEGLERLHPQWFEEFYKVVKEKKLRVKDLIAGNKYDQEHIKRMKNVAEYEVRPLPKGMNFVSDAAILNNRVLFFSFTTSIFCVDIESPDIATSMKNLFDLAWASAKPFLWEK